MADQTIDQLTEDLSPILADFIVTSDQSAGPGTRKAKIANIPIVNGQSAATPLGSDSLVFFDADVGGNAKATISDVIAAAAAFGEISVTTPVETVLSDTVTFMPILGTFALTAGAVGWDMNTNGQLRYVGTPTRRLHIAAAASMTAASNNQTIEFVIMKNGTAIGPSRIQRRVATGADVGAASFHAFVSVDTNDFLQIGVRNTTTASNITATTANLFAECLG